MTKCRQFLPIADLASLRLRLFTWPLGWLSPVVFILVQRRYSASDYCSTASYALLACFALAAGLAGAAGSLTCEGTVSKEGEVQWSLRAITIKVDFTDGFGMLDTDDDTLGKNIALELEENPISISARQLSRRQENGHSFGVSALTISRKAGRFYIEADLRTKASVMPLMTVGWTGIYEKFDPTRNKF